MDEGVDGAYADEVFELRRRITARWKADLVARRPTCRVWSAAPAARSLVRPVRHGSVGTSRVGAASLVTPKGTDLAQ